MRGFLSVNNKGANGVKCGSVKRFISVFLCLALLITYIPVLAMYSSPVVAFAAGSSVADPGTADTWENMMGTDKDGNRYAGRVWADKSVYTDGQTVILNNSGDAGSVFDVVLEDDEAFQIVFSALGSSMTTFEAGIRSDPMDVVTDDEDVPFIYVDNIGQYMEIKEMEAVTLFGSSHGIVNNGDGTYTVQAYDGVNPTTNDAYNTAEDISISVTENSDGTQKLQIEIKKEILPNILEQVVKKNVGGIDSATISELSYGPLRVYYTVGLRDDILLPNGEVDLSKIDKDYKYIDKTTGEITFYSNTFGVMNEGDAVTGKVQAGDAHIEFKPSRENRYYYHQSNQGIYADVNLKDGSEIVWEDDEYGVLYEEGKYDFTYLTYDDYKTLADDAQVYTYVKYYRPTVDVSDSANAAELVDYIVYTDWGYLKESAAFFDHNVNKYINYDETSGYVTADIGYAIEGDKVEATLNSYISKNPGADIQAMLGVGSLRTSRLHNMAVEKALNNTDTAVLRYDPEYTYETAEIHNGNDVVVWLGNNGKVTTGIGTGIALTKTVTEVIGDADDTYALTVTVPKSVSAVPTVKDSSGNDVTAEISSYENNILTVNVRANETVYISGIPAGTECNIGEIADGDYYIASKTDTVTVPSLGEVLNGAVQYASAVVTNAPNKYGNLYITKEITSTHFIPDSILEQEFDIEVNVGDALAGKTYTVSDSAFESPYDVTVDDDGSISFTVNARQTVKILGLPEGTMATVTEKLTDSQKEIFTTVYRTRDHSGEPADSDNTVTIPASANATAIITGTYAPKAVAVDIDIAGTKVLNSEETTDLEGGSFIFKVQQWNGTAWEDIDSKSAEVAYAAGESGTKSFTIEDVLDGIIYTETESYAYQVLEVKGSIADLTYDRALYAFTVTVTDDNGQLVATVTDLNNTEITDGSYEVTFTNTYNTAPLSIDVVMDVVNSSGDVGVSKAGFGFAAIQTDSNWNKLVNGVTLTAYSNAVGEARFTATYNEVGTYYYVVSEVGGTRAGWDYSKAEYRVTVTVEEENGALVSSITIIPVDGTAVDGEIAEVSGNRGTVHFKKTYDPADATVDMDNAVKTAAKGKNLAAGGLTFKIYKNGTTDTVLTGTNDAEGNVDFDGVLTFDKAGKYEYDVVQLAGGVIGMTYDTTVYDLVVEVVNNMTAGCLEAVYYFEDSTTDTVTFRNTYTVTSAGYTVSGVVTMIGRAVASDEFSVGLYSGDELIEAVTNKADGSFEFSRITYTEAGEYVYTVKEIVPDNKLPGVTYDTDLYTVKVTVTDSESVLSAVADVQNSSIKFENNYKAAPADVTFTGKAILKGAELEDNAFTFKLYRTDRTFDITADSASCIGETRNTDGLFRFDTVSHDTPGAYFYVIVEETGDDTAEDMIYDATGHNFRVQISDIGDGQLKAYLFYLNKGAVTAPMADIISEVSFTNATFGAVAETKVYLDDKEIDGSEVKVGDILTYRITYTNYTGDDTVVDILAAIPAYTTYVEESVSHNGVCDDGQVNWHLSVVKDASVTVSFSVRVDAEDAVISNTAVIRDLLNTYITNEVKNSVAGTVTPPPVTDDPPVDDPVEPDVTTTDGADKDEPEKPAADDPVKVPAETVTGKPSVNEPQSSPQTDGAHNLGAWFALMCVSGGCVFGTVLYGKRKKAEEN